MTITNAADAANFLRSNPSMGVVREVISGLYLRDSTMSGCERYSNDEVLDNLEAIGSLKRAYFAARGVAWTPLAG